MPHMKSREYGGERQGLHVVQWLNGARQAKSTKSYSRVVRIYALLLQLAIKSKEYQPVYAKPELLDKDKKYAEKYTRIITESRGLAEQLNCCLQRYRMHPEIEARLGEGGVYLQWSSSSARSKWGFTIEVDDSRQTIERMPVRFPGLSALITEPRAVLLLLELARSRYVSRVRPCQQCETWFYARLPQAKFCSRACQQSHFRTSEDFKNHKKEYMRKLRQMKKTKSFK